MALYEFSQSKTRSIKLPAPQPSQKRIEEIQIRLEHHQIIAFYSIWFALLRNNTYVYIDNIRKKNEEKIRIET